ncbi:MAG: hypothetical protein ACM34L_09800 [Gemmatimonas sp.]|nr:hypothetical protein [Gemmatimonadaceae bacterium]
MNGVRDWIVGTSLIGAAVLSACSHSAAPADAPKPGASGAAPAARAVSGSTQASTAVPLVTPANATLKPSKLVYVARLFSEGQAHKLGFRTLELSEASYEGQRVWLLAESRKVNTMELAESLYVSQVSLEPVHRVVHTADMDITTQYTRDSILTKFEGDSGGDTRVAVPNERNLVGNIYWIEPLLASLPLAQGWQGNATTVFVGPHDHARVMMHLAVIGQDSVLAPDGNFDCWKLALQVGETEEHLWVRKADGVLIKEETPVAGIAAAKVELLIAQGQAPKLGR